MNFLGIVNLLAAPIDTIRIVRIISVALAAFCALALVVLVLLQPSASENMGALTGQSYDSFYSKNKVRTREGVMKRLTIIISILMAVAILVFFCTGIAFDF